VTPFVCCFHDFIHLEKYEKPVFLRLFVSFRGKWDGAGAIVNIGVRGKGATAPPGLKISGETLFSGHALVVQKS